MRVLLQAKAFGIWEKLQCGRTLSPDGGGGCGSGAVVAEGKWRAAGGGGAMSGMVVLDLCSLIAGPMAAMILADQGAECIKVELPQAPDPSRQMGQQPDNSIHIHTASSSFSS